MKDYIVGLDIGSSKVCATVGKLDKYRELTILGITSVNCSGLKKGIVVDIDNTSEAITKCIKKLNRMVDIDIDEVYISLPGGISEIINSTGIVAISSENREIGHGDVDRVLEAAKVISIPSDKEIIGIEPQQYIIDGFDNIKDPIGMSGLRLEVKADVLVAQTTIVNNLIKSVNKAGLEVKGIGIQPKVTSKVVLRREERDMGSALVDIGAETIDVSIIKNDAICYTSIIQIGGSNISNDIALGLKIPFNEAEKIKIKYADLRSNANINDANKLLVKSSFNEETTVDYNFLNEIIEARVEEILFFVKDEIIKSNYYEQINDVVFVGGGISQIQGILEFSKSLLGKPVRIGSPDYVGAANPIYAAVVGIVKDASESINQADIESKYSRDEENDSLWNQSKKNDEDVNIFSKVRNFLADFF